ncbi:MAG: MgtC/SapB family protein [Candidatus Margulisiibacteriota bacterium]
MQELLNMCDLTIVGRLLLAGLLGGIIGAERETKGKPGGLRTNMLIALGSALFVQVAMFCVASYNVGDPTRVIGQVITGIGFLGAGAIIQAGHSVRGMTSAATIWIMAGIGMAVGIGDYFAAVIATILILIILRVMNIVEKRVGIKSTIKTQESKKEESPLI